MAHQRECNGVEKEHIYLYAFREWTEIFPFHIGTQHARTKKDHNIGIKLMAGTRKRDIHSRAQIYMQNVTQKVLAKKKFFTRVINVQNFFK